MPVVIDSFIISTVTKNNFHGGVVACEYLLKVEVVCGLPPIAAAAQFQYTTAYTTTTLCTRITKGSLRVA